MVMALEHEEKQKPYFSDTVTFGRELLRDATEIIFFDPQNNYKKVIVNRQGYFEDFPGIVKAGWTKYLGVNYDFDNGEIHFRTSIEKYGNGYMCLWEIQPDGRYWADDGGFGMENDVEIVLCAYLDEKCNFKGPFQLHSIR